MDNVKTSCLRNRYPSGSDGDVWISSLLPQKCRRKDGRNGSTGSDQRSIESGGFTLAVANDRCLQQCRKTGQIYEDTSLTKPPDLQ